MDTLFISSPLQIFPEAEGWPFPKYLGSCGRLIVSTSTRPLKEFYSVSPDVAADLALQLLAIIDSMMNNDLNYHFYFTHIDADTFGVFTNGYLFIRDASRLGITDVQEGTQLHFSHHISRECNKAGRKIDVIHQLLLFLASSIYKQLVK